MKTVLVFLFVILFSTSFSKNFDNGDEVYSGNPILQGWYADPASAVYNDEYWIFPTYSDYYHRQVFFEKIPGEDEYYIIYHRRPLEETHRNHRVVCIEKLEFDKNGKIKPVKISFTGVPKRPLKNR